MVVVLAIAFSSLMLAQEAVAARRLPVQQPKFRLDLTLAEFSFLHGSVASGLNRYGGSVGLDIEVERAGSELRWKLLIPRQEDLRGLDRLVSERTTELVASTNFEKLDEQAKSDLQACRNLVAKLSQAQTNPQFELVSVAGQVEDRGGEMWLVGEFGTYQIRGRPKERLTSLGGLPVVATGYVPADGEFVLVSCFDRHPGGTVAFVRANCRESLRLLPDLLTRVKPEPELHYLIDEGSVEGHRGAVARGGSPELDETMIQLAIKEHFPRFYRAYLLERASRGPEAPWQDVTAAAGGDSAQRDYLASISPAERQRLLAREIDYISARCPPGAPSPMVVHEGRPLATLRSLLAMIGSPEAVSPSSESRPSPVSPSVGPPAPGNRSATRE